MVSAPVLVVGGGISGLAFAQGLYKNGIDFLVFERDPDPSARSQGYRIRLNEGFGALKRTVRLETVAMIENTCAQTVPGLNSVNAITGESLVPTAAAMVRAGVVDQNNQPTHSKSQGDSFSVDRSVLRDLLLGDIRDRIVFGKAFSHYEENIEGVVAYFTDGTSQAGCFLVGADGSNSRVRKQLIPDFHWIDADTFVFFGKSPLTADLELLLQKHDMKGMQLFKDPSARLSMLSEEMRWSSSCRGAASASGYQLPVDYIYWVLSCPRAELSGCINNLDGSDNQSAARAVLALTQRWTGSCRGIIEAQDPVQTARMPLYTIHPESQPWATSAFVTILGDAAHTMPPTAGGGANAALLDAEQLVGVFQRNQKAGLPPQEIRAYEDEMRTTAAWYVRRSLQAAKNGFGLKVLEDLQDSSCS